MRRTRSGGQQRRQRRRDAIDSVAGLRQRGAHVDEPVDHVGESDLNHRNARAPQLSDIGDRLVAQWIETGVQNDRRRQTGKIGRKKR